MTTIKETVIAEFTQRYGTAPAILVRAPGRVNLIGEHTDYNDGFVMPMAIDRAIWIALQPRSDGKVGAYALDVDDYLEFDTADFSKGNGGPVEYIKGVTWALQEAGYTLNGWEGVFSGDVPRGAGLSSSAALELAIARAFYTVSDFEWQPHTIAKLAQRAENQWVGMNSGIMDQMISAVGESGHALMIDCRTLETSAYPLPPETAVVIMDTGTRRELVGSAYNERRQQCETAAAFFGVKALRDVSLRQFQETGSELDTVTHRRARHVVTENARVLKAREAMQAGDAGALGHLLNASHASLRDDFEVSSPALDAMVTVAREQEGCYGARMTGAGFGGCAVALVNNAHVDAFVAAVTQEYQARVPHQPALYVCSATDGASTIPLDS